MLRRKLLSAWKISFSPNVNFLLGTPLPFRCENQRRFCLGHPFCGRQSSSSTISIWCCWRGGLGLLQPLKVLLQKTNYGNYFTSWHALVCLIWWWNDRGDRIGGHARERGRGQTLYQYLPLGVTSQRLPPNMESVQSGYSWNSQWAHTNVGWFYRLLELSGKLVRLVRFSAFLRNPVSNYHSRHFWGKRRSSCSRGWIWIILKNWSSLLGASNIKSYAS